MKVTIVDRKGDFYYIMDETLKYYIIEVTDDNELIVGDSAVFSLNDCTIVDKGISADCLVYSEDVSDDRWNILKYSKM